MAIDRPGADDPELLIGCTHGIRSERRLYEEVHLNLAYRWFRRLGLEGAVPDHSTFSENRHGRLRDSDLLRRLLATTVERWLAEGLVASTWRNVCYCQQRTFFNTIGGKLAL